MVLKALIQAFVPSRDTKQLNLKEIFCFPKFKKPIKSFRVRAVGVERVNLDGSDRQQALKRLKVGEKIRLIWNSDKAGQKKYLIYLVRSGMSKQLSMTDCFGRLNDKVAADVIRWMTRDNIATSANVAKIVGGTRKHPKLGCVLELKTYPAPKK